MGLIEEQWNFEIKVILCIEKLKFQNLLNHVYQFWKHSIYIFVLI